MERGEGRSLLQIRILSVARKTSRVGALKYIIIYKNKFCIGHKSLDAMSLCFSFIRFRYTFKKLGIKYLMFFLMLTCLVFEVCLGRGVSCYGHVIHFQAKTC